MGNDYRRDHSFRSPRPDLSIQYGTPNACTGCHDDQTDKWALEYVQKWYGEDPPEHYSTYLSRLQREEVALRADLDSLLADSTPVIIQASSLAIVGAYQSPEYLDVFEAGLKDKNAVIRQAAVRFYYHQDEQVLKRKMIGMLRDSVLGIRIEAALKLGRSSLQPEGEEDIKLFESATAELIDAMEHSADFQTTNHNLATFYSGLGDAVKAEKYFKEAIRIDNRFYPAQINLALLYNGQKRNAEAEMVLKEVVDKNPDVPDGPYYLGLLLTEAGRMDEAIEYFEMTTKLTPDNPRVFYNLGLACQQVNKPVKAEKALARAMEIAPHNPEYIYALIYFYMQNGNKSKAKKWALTMTERFPNIPAGREILREIER
jgi:Tfp pilus assembly protein PilF